MSATDLVLRIEASSNPNADARTVRVYQIIDESQAPVEVYKVRIAQAAAVRTCACSFDRERCPR